MGNKYIIEIEESYSRDGWPNEDTPDVLYRIKGFNSLVFDQRGLDKLEKYDPDEEYNRGFDRGYAYSKTENELPSYAYEKGLNDAWEAARKIAFPKSEGGIAGEDMVRVFGFTYWVHAMEKLTATEAIAKIKAYEEKQKDEAEIRVGDEVVVNGLTGVVMKLDEKGNVDRYFTCDGRTFGNISGFQNNEVKKTGRHFPEVAELLEKMKEGGEK